MISLIACVDNKNGIGLNGTIPWTLKPDMKYFRKLTSGATIIMGRLTWESIGSKPLPNRDNVVITSTPELINGAFSYSTLDEAILMTSSILKPIFIIGGSRIYEEALLNGASKVYLTRIDYDYNCDTTFPFDELRGFECKIGEWLFDGDIKYRFETYYK